MREQEEYYIYIFYKFLRDRFRKYLRSLSFSDAGVTLRHNSWPDLLKLFHGCTPNAGVLLVVDGDKKLALQVSDHIVFKVPDLNIYRSSPKPRPLGRGL